MAVLVYILLGILDVYALFALMFRTFRLPYFEYVKEIGIIATIISVTSYFVRIYFDAPGVLDIVLHFILYIIFFRFLIKVRTSRSIMISFVYFGYGLISALWYVVYSKLPVTAGASTYLIQLSQIVTSFLMAYILFKTNKGFSFIVRPPHNLFVKRKINKQEMIIINIVLLVSAVSFLMAVFILNYQSFVIIPLNLVIFAVLIYLAYRRDMTDGLDRISRLRDSVENKKI